MMTADVEEILGGRKWERGTASTVQKMLHLDAQFS